ncbi:MAG: Radical domain protein [Cyanobacteria bacterium RYN_339]|nr:Radical domain protein [Cyanobacteria bacterium RYN_339]
MHKLCLINPPELAGFVSDRDKAGGIGVARPYQASWRVPYLPPTPPMDLLYAAAIAEQEGVSLRFLDAIGNRWDREALLARVAGEHASHIGVRVSLASLDADLALVNELKARHPGSQVFVFGHASQTTYTKWLKHSKADAVFYGEVEALLMPYLRGEASDHILEPQGDKKACFSWSYVQELDELPYPAWHHVDIAQYSPSGKVEDFVFYILTSRGCPKGCSMCPYYVHQGKQWRFREVDKVMQEFEYLRGLGARYIQTRDPNISWRKKHLLAIAERLKGEQQFKISTETDLEVLNESDLVALRDAGFVRIMTGVESVDESILKEIHQNGNALRRSLENMTIAQKVGIGVTGFFIVGSLQETWQSVRNTVATAKALPCSYSVSLMTPYFGTEMREEYVKAGFYQEREGFKDYNGYTGMVRTTGLDYAEVTLAHAWAAAELELVQRKRQLADAGGTAKLLQAARVAAQGVRTLSLRARVTKRANLAVPPLAVPAAT